MDPKPRQGIRDSYFQCATSLKCCFFFVLFFFVLADFIVLYSMGD